MPVTVTEHPERAADGTVPVTVTEHPERAADGTLPVTVTEHPERAADGTLPVTVTEHPESRAALSSLPTGCQFWFRSRIFTLHPLKEKFYMVAF